MNPKVVSIINGKGGIGKTAVVYNTAHTINFLMSKINPKFKILMIDNDPMASLTQMYIDPENDLSVTDTLYRIYEDEPRYDDNIIFKTNTENLDVVYNIYLTNYKNSGLNGVRGLFRLRKFIETSCLDYDLILLDNGPSDNNFHQNAYVASDYFIVPTTLTAKSLENIKIILSNATDVKNNVNPKLDLAGILINMLDNRKSNHQIYYKLLKDNYSDLLFRTTIHSRAAISNADDAKRPITDYKNSLSYKEYSNFAKELLSKIGVHKFPAHELDKLDEVSD